MSRNEGKHGSLDDFQTAGRRTAEPQTSKDKKLLDASQAQPHKPRLKFVNSTNPDQLRTQQYRKLVKQHAMLDAQSRRREAVQANIAKRRAQYTSASSSQEPPPLPRRDDTLSYYGHYDEQEVLDKERLSPRMQMYIGRSSVDPFRTLPQFSNKQIDAERLQYLTLAFFPSLQRSEKYVSTMTSSPIVFLADAHPGMILQDCLDERPHGGVMTMAAKAELYTLLNQRLRSINPAVQLAPDVIAGIFNLILLENSYGDYNVVSTHLKGLRQMMDIIAGSRKAGFDPNLATVSVYQGLETAIYFEIAPNPFYLKLSSTVQANLPEVQATELAFWESPINDNPFIKAALSDRCTSSTLWMLRSMHELTNLFLSVQSSEPPNLTNNQRALEIYQALVRMPSASEPYLATTGDNIYECIRITSLIWCTAITYSLPLSSALAFATERTKRSLSLTEALIQAMKRTGTNDCWGHALIGSFMWVVKTACAALQNGSIAFKWVYLENARACIHGLRHRLYVDILTGSERMLQVQEGLRKPRRSSERQRSSEKSLETNTAANQ